MMEGGKEETQVVLDPLVHAKVKSIAKLEGVSVEDWVNEILRKAVRTDPKATEALIQTIREAGNVNAPVWIVEGMLQEFESWRRRG